MSDLRQDAARVIVQAREAVATLRDAARLGIIIEFRQRDPLVTAIHRAIDHAEALEARLAASEAQREYALQFIANAVQHARETYTGGGQVAASEAGSPWQQIETGPKDGSVVLLYARERKQHIYGRGYWFQGDGGEGWIAYAFFGQPEDHLRGSFQPTHWMPLPAAPPADASPLETDRSMSHWQTLCACGHGKLSHPFGLSEALVFDGSCEFCECEEFQLPSADASRPSQEDQA